MLLWKEIRGVLEVEEKREERLRKWIDPKLESLYSINGALSLAALARACTQDESWQGQAWRKSFLTSVLSFNRLLKSENGVGPMFRSRS